MIPGSGYDKSLSPIRLEVAQMIACAPILGNVMNFNFMRVTTINTDHKNRSVVSADSNDNGVKRLERSCKRRANEAIDDEVEQKSPRIQLRFICLKIIVKLPLKERKRKLRIMQNRRKIRREENEMLKRTFAVYRENITSRSKLKSIQEKHMIQ